MKANEAPEKLYLFENPISGTPDDRWLSKRSDETDIEYTRTDAFIEKACQFLSEKCDLCIYEEFNPENRTYYINYDKIVEDFRKYMRGE